MANRTKQAYFNFCGEFIASKNRPLMNDAKIETKRGTMNARSMSFGVKDGNNVCYVDAFDFARDKILTYSQAGEKIEVSWDDRLDEDVIKSVASYRKYTVNLGERKEFITAYDMIGYLAETLPTYEGDIVVTGQFNMQADKKGTIRTKFNLGNVYAAQPEQDKRHFSMTADLYYNKESIDKTDLKESKKVYINGYLPIYVNAEEGTKFFPFSTVFNTSVYNLENEKHKALYEYRMKYIDTKSKNYQHMLWEMRVVNGAEEIPFDESMLTTAQKEQITLGIHDVDFFKPRKGILGNSVKEFRLFDPKLIGEYSDGMLDCDFTNKEFEEMIFVPTHDERLADVVAGAEAKPETKPGVDDEDLF